MIFTKNEKEVNNLYEHDWIHGKDKKETGFVPVFFPCTKKNGPQFYET